MNVQIMGLGYIGLPTAVVMAEAGHKVTGYDVSSFVIDSIKSRKLHIEEKGLDNLVAKVLDSGKFRVVSTPEMADYHIICVPTPFRKDTGGHSPDLSYIMSATESLAAVITSGSTIILESTSPVGATLKVAQKVKELRPDLAIAGIDDNPEVFFAYCPERIIPGDMLRELKENDRVIGGVDKSSSEKAGALYSSFVKGQCILTSSGVAEMVKLTENSFRDVNIAFANELSIICDKIGIPVEEVIKYANHHPRVNILSPGPGVGGHCIAVDPWFIVDSNPKEAQLIQTARQVNDSKPEFVIKKVKDAAEKFPEAKIYCLGLTYKPDVDDFRESPALEIFKRLTQIYGKDRVLGVDPYYKNLKNRTTDLNFMEVPDSPFQGDIVVALVRHSIFQNSKLKGADILLDFCRLTE